MLNAHYLWLERTILVSEDILLESKFRVSHLTNIEAKTILLALLQRRNERAFIRCFF